MKQLRDYQQECIDTVLKRLSAGEDKQLVVLATGMGKTFTACELIRQGGFKKVLWITHAEELINQSAAALDTILDEEYRWIGIGRIKAEMFEIHTPIVVASIQTLWRRLDRIPSDHFDLIIVDEAHYAMAQTWTKAINHFHPRLRLGLTATPFRLDGVSLLDLFNEITFERDIKFGVDNGYLCEQDAIRIKTQTSLDDVRTTGGEFNQKDLRKLDIPERNSIIVCKWKEYCVNENKDQRKTIAFCVDIEHAKNLAQTFRDAGIRSQALHSEMDSNTRWQLIQDFKKGLIDVLTNVMILTAGFDEPEVSNIIAAAPTKSRTKYMQQIGRGTRLKQGVFKDCRILDVVDVTSKHSLINAMVLDGERAPEDRIFMSKEKKALFLAAIAEKRKREAFINHHLKKDHKVDIFKLPKVKVSRFSTYDEPASEKQLAWLEKLGYNIIDDTYTKGQCSEIITGSPARAIQIAELKHHGYDVSNGVTIGEYQAAIQEIERRKAGKDVQAKGFIVKNLR